MLTQPSYDEHLALYDMRAVKRPLLQQAIGGGLWRVKWHPSDDGLLLTGNMHNGFAALRLDLSAGRLSKVLRRSAPHTSLGYGADWSQDPVTPMLAGCCSFYDRLCTLWTVDMALADEA